MPLCSVCVQMQCFGTPHLSPLESGICRLTCTLSHRTTLLDSVRCDPFQCTLLRKHEFLLNQSKALNIAKLQINEAWKLEDVTAFTNLATFLLDSLKVRYSDCRHTHIAQLARLGRLCAVFVYRCNVLAHVNNTAEWISGLYSHQLFHRTTLLHSARCDPLHAQCDPLHVQCDPSHARCDPLHAQCDPSHARCDPSHAQCDP